MFRKIGIPVSATRGRCWASPEDVAEFGAPGSPIEGSKLRRAYCACCGEPCRTTYGGCTICNQCDDSPEARAGRRQGQNAAELRATRLTDGDPDAARQIGEAGD